MTPLEGLAIGGAGMAAGAINTIVGSGSLISFPTLIGLGYSPLVANVSNSVGLVAGSVSGVVGYRRELQGQRERVRRFAVSSLLGGAAGAATLLLVPSAFEKVVPFLVLLACLLVIVQPWLARRLRDADTARAHRVGVLDIAIFVTAVYGGYFGAAQGVIYIALLAIFIDDHLQRLNGLKNVMSAMVNGIGAVIFAVFAPMDWAVAGLIALGAIVGGQLGARYGRRLAPQALRAVIVIVGVAVTVKLFLDW